MKVRARGKRLPTVRKPQPNSGGYGRLFVVFAAAAFLLWALASRGSSLSITGRDSLKNIEKREMRGDGIVRDSSNTVTTAGGGVDGDSTHSPTSYATYKPQKNGTFSTHRKAMKTGPLAARISRGHLQTVLLDRYRLKSEKDARPVSDSDPACAGSICPKFDYCYEGLENVGVCVKDGVEDLTRINTSYPLNCPTTDSSCVQEPDLQPHEKWSAQIFVVSNVFLNVAGQAFNATHLFDHNGCSAEQRFTHVEGKAVVTEFRELVSMVDWFGWNARSTMLDLLPALTLLDAVMPALKGVPVAYGHRLGHRRTQLEQMQATGMEDILGVELDNWNPHILEEPNLFFAEKLFLPLHQRCGRPSRVLWKRMRSHHFLKKNGLPLYKEDWTPLLVSGSIVSPGRDWVVLLGMKKEKKGVLEELRVEEEMVKLFGRSRVLVYYEGAMPMPRRKEVLNRAKLLVAMHDNVLTDMVFMPPGGAIVEIRPKKDADPTYHHLAEVCELDYYLAFCDGKKGDGKKPSTLEMKDPATLYKILGDVAKKIKQ